MKDAFKKAEADLAMAKFFAHKKMQRISSDKLKLDEIERINDEIKNHLKSILVEGSKRALGAKKLV